MSTCETTAKTIKDSVNLPKTKIYEIVTDWNILLDFTKDQFLQLSQHRSDHSSLCSPINGAHGSQSIDGRLSHPLHKDQNMDALESSLRYMYHIIRVGILVVIKDNKIQCFVPFANPNYTNNWHSHLLYKTYGNRTTPRLDEYLSYKKRVLYKARDINPDTSKWGANAYFINNSNREDVWGQHSLTEYEEMLTTTLENRSVSDTIFFLNKRDYPVLRSDLKEPYHFMWRGEHPVVNLSQIKYIGSMIPVTSPYSNPDYLDIPFPVPQDWILASSPMQYFSGRDNSIKWESKRPTVFFRGSLTGRVDPDLNQRYIASKMSYDLYKSERTVFNGNLVPVLDIGITSWNLSDKVDKHGHITFSHPKQLGIKLANKVSMDEAVNKYRFILNIDGHSKTNRTSYILSSNSLMIMVDSEYTVGRETWIDEYLVPYQHYVPVNADLSNLVSVVRWCIANPDQCKQMVANANRVAASLFTKDAIMDRVALTLNKIASSK